VDGHSPRPATITFSAGRRETVARHLNQPRCPPTALAAQCRADAAYESLLKSRRQVLHRRIADALRERFTTIAERAMHGSAFNEAIAHLDKARGLAEELSESPTRRLLRARLQTTYGYAVRLS